MVCWTPTPDTRGIPGNGSRCWRILIKCWWCSVLREWQWTESFNASLSGCGPPAWAQWRNCTFSRVPVIVISRGGSIHPRINKWCEGSLGASAAAHAILQITKAQVTLICLTPPSTKISLRNRLRNKGNTWCLLWRYIFSLELYGVERGLCFEKKKQSFSVVPLFCHLHFLLGIRVLPGSEKGRKSRKERDQTKLERRNTVYWKYRSQQGRAGN